MSDASAELDCLACGACCRGDPGWIHVWEKDDATLEALPNASDLIVETRVGGFVRRSLRMAHGECAALDRTPGRAFCTIYPSRPSVCRELEAGSPDCRAARRRSGLESAP